MTIQPLEVTYGNVTSDIPESVRSFYDPNQYFTSSEDPDRALLRWLDNTRLDMPVSQPYDPQKTRKLIAVEQAHIGMLTLDNAAEQHWLELKTPDIEQAVDTALAYAKSTAEFCLSAMLKLRDDHGASLKNTHDITLAGVVLSANTHKGQTRVVGNRPYYSHPRDVALLLHASYITHKPDPSGLSLPLYEFTGLLHDGLEDTIPRKGGSFLAAENVITSPLVLSEVLGRLGVSLSTAQHTSRSILALTKTVGFDGRMAYEPYIERFQEFKDCIPTKLADLQHNYRIDSKSPELKNPEKNHKLYLKKQEYHLSQQKLLQYYSNSDHASDKYWLQRHLFAAKIITLTQNDLQSASITAGWSQIPPHTIVDAYESAVQKGDA